MGLIGIIAGLVGAAVRAVVGIAGGLIGAGMGMLGALLGLLPVFFPLVLIALGVMWLVRGSKADQATGVHAVGSSPARRNYPASQR